MKESTMLVINLTTSVINGLFAVNVGYPLNLFFGVMSALAAVCAVWSAHILVTDWHERRQEEQWRQRLPKHLR